MSYENLYSLINLAVVPAWLLLIILPKSEITRKLVHSGVYPVVYGLFYFVLIVRSMFFGVAAEGASMSTLDGVMTMFTHPNSMVVGWAHYLVFDLFVGAWISRDAIRRGMNHLMVIPCLFFTFMFGPIGLLMYVILRKVTSKGGLVLDEVEQT
ncbi:ABA4-like family protein [Kordiimonas aquimaris]|uniref:ABA4-like family protein n=1 Tax=Kordiimonas aquimaris TaxID=707591 RepID=UPI0021CF94B6|nr:ABA4-like family protein [Kordiimonas aquimaris]